MHKSHKYTKIALACLLAAVTAAPAALNIAAPLRTSAVELLGECSFERKILPWQAYQNAPAKQIVDIQDGALHTRVAVPSGANDEYGDLQLKYKGLDFKAGHTYKISFRAKASRDGAMIYSRLTSEPFVKEYASFNDKGGIDIGPAFDGQWCIGTPLTTEYQTFSGLFVPPEDITGAAWSMSYATSALFAGTTTLQGDEFWFDDMHIDCITCGDEGICQPADTAHCGMVSRSYSGMENNFISVNQLGYFVNGAKNAALGDNSSDWTMDAQTISLEGSYTYEIVKTSDRKVVFTGKTEKAAKDAASGETVCKIDFSKFNTPGEYYLRIKGQEWRSLPFRISDDIYRGGHDLLTNALNYFYQNRAGLDIDPQYITSGNAEKLSHPAGIVDDRVFVQKKAYRGSVLQYEAASDLASSEISAQGGWYSGDSHCKSLTEGSMTVWLLQNMYERMNAVRNAGEKYFGDGSDRIAVPESENGAPDLLDECRYELDFMAKMKVSEDEPAWGKFAGLYFSKVEDYTSTGLAVKPWTTENEVLGTVRIVRQPTFAATLNYAACAAQAARLWKEADPEYADSLLQSAKDAFAAFQKYYHAEDPLTDSLYPLDTDLRSEENANPRELRDDEYWAACELFISCSRMGKKEDADSYHKLLAAYDRAFTVSERMVGLNAIGSYTMFNLSDVSAVGSLSLTLNKDLLPDAQQKKLTDSLLETADDYLSTQKKEGYGTPYKYDGPYPYDLDPAGMYQITGYERGSNVRVLANVIGMAYAYDLTRDDKYLNGVTTGMDYLLGNNPMAFSFITGYGSYAAQNPTHSFWANSINSELPKAPDGVLVSGPAGNVQDPYMVMLGFDPSQKEIDDMNDMLMQRSYADAAEAWAVNEATLTGNAELAWVAAFLDEYVPGAEEPVLPCDVNADGKADHADAEALMQYLLGSGRIASPAAADLDQNGSLNAVDLSLLKQALKAMQETDDLPVTDK